MNFVPEIKVEGQVESDELWFKDAIIYQLHVKAFADSNSDGIGDFAGLTSKLDYLEDLGVTALWLLPFYPSPGRDDGYDISDYRHINPDFGTMQDFRRFMQEAKRRKLRVITELVINHTSDQHPWFQRARRGRPSSDARNWYVWSDTDHRFAETRIIFSDTEKSNWTWDQDAQAYYWHRFFSHQPDLNFDNPRVLLAMVQIMRRWLDLGVDGFRLDAIPYLCEREGTNNENLPETHAIIKKIRAELDAYSPGKVLLAEANQWPEDVNAYFGEGDECHMAYHFPLMPRIYMAIAQEDRFPIADILRQTPDIPGNCQWALFLRNHDELTLEMVTDVERDYLWSTYATDPRARINLGIRRRLASLMDNDRRKIELMNSLLMSFPGTPIIYYGDEIGMGDNIYLGDRNGVRTPMQWTPDRNGGFSRCDPARLYLPMIMDPVYGYEAVNVEAQSRSLASLLSWTKRLISVRKSSKVFGRGSLSFIRRRTARCSFMFGSIRVRSCSASPTCRGRRRPPRSTCRPGGDASRSNCLGARTSRRSAMVPTSSRLRPTGSFGSCSVNETPRTQKSRAHRRNSRHSSLPRDGVPCRKASPDPCWNATCFRHFWPASAGSRNGETWRRAPVFHPLSRSCFPTRDLGWRLSRPKAATLRRTTCCR